MEDFIKRYSISQIGSPLKESKGVMILLHGRGAMAEDILSLVSNFNAPKLTYLAPQAKRGSWYPLSFLAPIEQNEPGVSLGIKMINDIVLNLSQVGFASQKIIILGFSQGACLTLEFAARHPKRYGGIIGLSGGLIGDRLNITSYQGRLEGTPAFLGCSDVDQHIPKTRVEESAVVLESLNAKVTKKIYPNMGHTINEDEIAHVRKIIKNIEQDDGIKEVVKKQGL